MAIHTRIAVAEGHGYATADRTQTEVFAAEWNDVIVGALPVRRWCIIAIVNGTCGTRLVMTGLASFSNGPHPAELSG